MYALRFADGEHETFGCLAGSRTFVSNAALQRHFEREPFHKEVTVTGSDIEESGTEHGTSVVRAVGRRPSDRSSSTASNPGSVITVSSRSVEPSEDTPRGPADQSR